MEAVQIQKYLHVNKHTRVYIQMYGYVYVLHLKSYIFTHILDFRYLPVTV